MKKTFTERNLVVILFVMVLVTFSFAQQDSKKLEKLYLGFKVDNANPLTSVNDIKPVVKSAEKIPGTHSIN